MVSAPVSVLFSVAIGYLVLVLFLLLNSRCLSLFASAIVSEVHVDPSMYYPLSCSIICSSHFSFLVEWKKKEMLERERERERKDKMVFFNCRILTIASFRMVGLTKQTPTQAHQCYNPLLPG